jgi:hypothetical protein
LGCEGLVESDASVLGEAIVGVDPGLNGVEGVDSVDCYYLAVLEEVVAPVY